MSERRPITDGDLIAQLRRRSTARDESDPWVRDFVSVVGTKIDAGPADTPNRRFPALAGLAGAAAIVLVLVVALPRLGSGGPQPSSTPIATPPSTISTMPVRDFAARVSAGELRGETVLSNAEIRHGNGFGRATCPPPGPCPIGILAGADPSLVVFANYVATLDAAPGDGTAWSRSHLPSPPQAGVLVLSVDQEGRVIFVGRNPPEEIVSVLSEIAHVDLDAVPLEESRVVPAWLTGMGGVHSCPALPPEAWIRELPGRYCSGESWLVDSRPQPNSDPFSVPDDALQVQSYAYRAFAPQPTDIGIPEPRAGLYVIAKRLEGSGCPNGPPPCWQWEIIGRVTINGDATQAQPIATPTPTPTPTPTTAPSASPQPGPTERPPAAASVGCGRFTNWVDPPSGARITTIDLTGLVDRCHSWSTTVEGPPVVIDTGIVVDDVLGISWLGTLCETRAAVTFAETGERFALTVHQPPISCSDGPTRHALMLTFSEAIPRELIDVFVLEAGPELPTPEPRPEPTINVQPLREQANQALARWADAVAEVGGHGIVFLQGTTDQSGDWEDDVGQNNKSALYAGLIEAHAELDPAPPSPGEVRWPDGMVTPVDLLSAGDALLELSEHATSQCERCQPLRVTGARLSTANFETDRGTTRVPVWKYTIAGTDVTVIQVAVANAISLIPPPWDPYNTPDGVSIVSARGLPESRELLFTTVDGVPPSDPARCTDYTAEAVESDLAVVVIITGFAQGDTSDTGCGVVALQSQLGERAVLEVTEGLPVLVLPR